MAYMSQEKKAKISEKLKLVLKKHGLKASLRVRNHSTIVCTITEGPIDFEKDLTEKNFFNKGNLQINTHWFHEHFKGASKEALTEIIEVLNTDNFDKSDIQTDYFHVGHFVDLNVGRWDKPYIVNKSVA